MPAASGSTLPEASRQVDGNDDEDDDVVHFPSKTQRWTTMAAFYAVSILASVISGLIPSFTAYIAKTKPGGLTTVKLIQMATKASVAPFSGIVGDRYNRVLIVSVGALLWGLAAVGLGFATDLRPAYFLAVITGLGQSLVDPSVKSLLADVHSRRNRGSVFGLLNAASALLSIAAQRLCDVVLGRTVGAASGWRFLFYLAGSIFIALAAVTHSAAHDPRARKKEAWVKSTWRDVKHVLGAPSFAIIALQGAAGAMAWMALNFLTLFLVLQGFHNIQAAIITIAFYTGCAVGGALGGTLGDVAYRVYGNHGRVMVVQVSVAAAVLSAPIVLKWLLAAAVVPKSTSRMVGVYSSVLFFVGAVIVWAGPNNEAMFAQIVPAGAKTLVYAFESLIETVVGTLAAPSLGVIVPLFGYAAAADGSDGSACNDAANSRALGNAMLVMMVVPWMVCLVASVALYWTVDRDEKRAKLLGSSPDASTTDASRNRAGSDPAPVRGGTGDAEGG